MIYNDHKTLTDIASISISDAAWVLYAPPHLTRWIEVDPLAQIPCWNSPLIYNLFIVIIYTLEDFKVSVFCNVNQFVLIIVLMFV